MLAGVVVTAIAIVVIAIAVSSGGGSSSGGTESTGLLKGGAQRSLVAQVSTLLSGIPQSGSTLGSPNAPVTMTYYGDLECPVCQAFTVQGGFPQLVQNDVRSGKVKVVYRAFQTATRSASTFQTQQVAALAAGQQQRFWQYTELFYHQQGAEDSGYVNEAYLTGLAQQVPGLVLSSWKSARGNSALSSQVASDLQAGSAAGVTGTPTLLFHGPKGDAEAPSGVPSYSDLEQTIKSVT